ncbi:TonB-dependent receptor domain-containing protein [Rhodosalinus sediminis]|uniref:TonB-dependent receptor domain-containing protein n=1 Tax=Rhodosalinus sediminis TaxID=1940533 RepID=UPI00235355DB|nr:TonB-dependent receptor [Rhodosalinus sediminis]
MRLICGAAAAALLAGESAAQEATGATPLGRLVLGAGAEKVAIDTPQAVTVLEQEDIDREQPRTAGDLFDSVPGVQAGGSSRVTGETFNIRGIGNAEPASQSRVVVNVDGTPKFFEQYRTGTFFGDPALYKRVEVLRGPASSTLYGSGAIGGVINFTTKDAADFLAPGETGALRFSGDYASNGDGAGAGVIFATRPREGAEFLFALNRDTSGDIEDGDGATLPGTDFDRLSGLVKGTFRFGEVQDQALRLSYSRTEGDQEDTAVAQTGGPVGGFGTSDFESRDETAVVAYSHAGAGNPWLDLEVTLSWSDTEVVKDDFSAGMACAPGFTQVLCDNEAAYETVTLKAENTVAFGGGAWENYLTFGAQLSEQERTATSSVGAMSFHPEGTDTRAALYAQGEFIHESGLTLIPGLRLERIQQEPAETAPDGGQDESFTAVSPKIAALYEVNDRWSVFGSLARTERAPTLDELYSTQGSTPVRGAPGTFLSARQPSLALDPETATTAELGFAYAGRDVLAQGDSLEAKVTAFHNAIDDLIGTTPRATGPDPAPVPYFSNIDEARIWGAELEAAYDAERWFSRAAYSLVRSEDEATGETLTDTPADTLALTLGGRMPEHGLRYGWRGTWAADITTESDATSADGYVTHDLFLDWTPERGPLEGVTVNLAVENLTDASYRPNLQLDEAPGRSFKVALTRQFSW